MPSGFCGTWDMISNANIEGYMLALGISTCVRKIALRLKLRKVIEKQGDLFIIKTLSTFRNYAISFRVDSEFQEFTKGLDNRHVKSVVVWQDSKLVCEQLGEKKNRGWAHWIEGDKLHLELYCEGEVCKQVFKKNEKFVPLIMDFGHKVASLHYFCSKYCSLVVLAPRKPKAN